MHFTIVSYTFPPSKEIGGRRWAKFSQQLVKKGNSVTVVCANEGVAQKWYEQEFPGVEIILLPKHYPEWLSGYTKSFKEKVLYWFVTRIVDRFTKMNVFDKGIAWRKPMLRSLEKIHAKLPIDVLVVTGAPFSLLAYASEFKEKYKKIKYVGDLRDPWTWGDCYGIPTMSSFKKNFQEESEYRTMESCDMIGVPTRHMVDFLKEKYSKFAHKLYLLPHAYDPEKFPDITKAEKREGFIYGGTLYNGIEEYILKLVEIVRSNPNSGFKWDIYTGSISPNLDSVFVNAGITKHKLVTEEQLFQKIKEASAYLVFFPVADKDLISTKFFEIIYTQTPILFIGEEGDVSRFIRENKLGVHILPSNMEAEIPKYLNGKVPFEKGHYDVSRYTFSSVTDQFLKAINDLKN